MKVTKISQPPFSSWSWIQEKGKSHPVIVGGVEFAQKAWQECQSIMGRGFSESRPSENRTFLKTLGCPQVAFSQVPSCAKSREGLRELAFLLPCELKGISLSPQVTGCLSMRALN